MKRKQNPLTEVARARVTPEQKAVWDRLGGAEFLRKTLDYLNFKEEPHAQGDKA